MEPSEHEIVLRTSNEDDVWYVWVAAGAFRGKDFLKQMTITHQDAHGTMGTLPKQAIKVNTKRRTLTPEYRAHLAERMRLQSQNPTC